MDERRRGVLKKYHQRLRTGVLVDNFLPALRLQLTDVEYSRVKDKVLRVGNLAAVDELIEILLTKENRDFEAFCAALEDNGHRHWARKLREEADEMEVNLTTLRSEVVLLEKSLNHVDTLLLPENNFTVMQEYASTGLALAEESLRILGNMDEDIKIIYPVNKARHAFSVVAEKARIFSDSLKAATKEFNDLQSRLEHMPSVTWGAWIRTVWDKLFGAYSWPDNDADTPDVRLPLSVVEKLEHSVALIKHGYLELMGACNTAKQISGEAAEVCAHKEKEAHNSTEGACTMLRDIHIFGIPRSGFLVGFGRLGMAAAASTMRFDLADGRTVLRDSPDPLGSSRYAANEAAAASTMGFGLAEGRTIFGANRSVSSHRVAKKFEAAAASFRTIQGKLASLLRTAHAF